MDNRNNHRITPVVTGAYTNPMQNFAKEKAVLYIQDKIKTKVVVAKIDIGFPKKIILESTLKVKRIRCYANKLAIDISMFQLFNNKIEINSVDLEGVTSNINRESPYLTLIIS
jgi:hypothetical protein